MNITLNDKTITLDNETSLQQLIERELSTTQNIAVAINNSLIKRTMWSSTILQEGDNVVVIAAAYGG
jgi:sulfur carrier protein